MMTICEQIDGYRITDTDDLNNTVIYFKKSKGWTRLLVEEIMCILEDAYDNVYQDAYDNGYQDGKEDQAAEDV